MATRDIVDVEFWVRAPVVTQFFLTFIKKLYINSRKKKYLKDKDILSPEDGICKYIELYDDDKLESIKNLDYQHSPNCIPYIKDIIEKRKNKHNNK